MLSVKRADLSPAIEQPETRVRRPFRRVRATEGSGTRLDTVVTARNDKRVRNAVLLAVAAAAEEFLSGDSDDEFAGDQLEEAIEALDYNWPTWRVDRFAIAATPEAVQPRRMAVGRR